jgi:hypothetical protein
MTVLQSAMASPEGKAAAEAASTAAAATADKPLWMLEAEHTAKVGVSAAWQLLCWCHIPARCMFGPLCWHHIPARCMFGPSQSTSVYCA